MSKTFGLIATFGNVHNLYKAAEEVCEAGFRHWDVYSPFPVHGMEGAMGLERSKVPAFTLIGGVTGFISGMLIAWYMGEFDFPLVVGGKPLFSPIFPFPVAYEMTILLASFGAFFGMFITNRLPRHHHPVMDFKKWPGITDDQFLILLEAQDEKFDLEETRKFLEGLKSLEVVELKE